MCVGVGVGVGVMRPILEKPKKSTYSSYAAALILENFI
jgi:hypothetical protein